MNQKCTPLCMLMNINFQNGIRLFFFSSKCFSLRSFFKRNSIQSKIRVYLRHVCEIVPTTLKKIAFSSFFENRKNEQLICFVDFFCSRCIRSKEFGLSFSTFSNFKNPKKYILGNFLVSLLICKKKLQISSY